MKRKKRALLANSPPFILALIEFFNPKKKTSSAEKGHKYSIGSNANCNIIVIVVIAVAVPLKGQQFFHFPKQRHNPKIVIQISWLENLALAAALTRVEKSRYTRLSARRQRNYICMYQKMCVTYIHRYMYSLYIICVFMYGRISICTPIGYRNANSFVSPFSRRDLHCAASPFIFRIIFAFIFARFLRLQKP